MWHVRIITGKKLVQWRRAAARRRGGAAIAPYFRASDPRGGEPRGALAEPAERSRRSVESELKALVETGTGGVAAEFPRRKLKTAWLTCVLQVGRSGDARESTGVELKRPSRPDICEIDGALCDMHHGRG